MGVMMRPRRTPISRAIVPALCLVCMAGCSSGPTEPTGNLLPPPDPPVDSPVAVLQALRYGYENMDLEFLETLFTDDFVFVFSQLDSAGNAFRNPPWMRVQELAYMEHLFVGGGAEPPADSISLDFTNSLADFPSSRPGHHPTWHREIAAEVNLRVRVGSGSYEIRGPMLFTFVRGDSAAIPSELATGGIVPDSTRWWIERWEDQTIQSAAPASRATASRVLPTDAFTWGALKVLYLEPAPEP